MTLPSQPNRGVALLMTLVAIVVILSAVAIAVRARDVARLADERRLDPAPLADLLLASDGPIRGWLTHESAGVVLPPDAPEPRVSVLEDHWSIDGRACCIRITAWDQLGMTPPGALAVGSPVRLGAAPVVLVAAEEHEGVLDADGLDSVAAVLRGTGAPVYPGADGVPGDAIGAHLATHNPPEVRARGRPSNGFVNLATAPMALVEAALRANGRGGLEQVRAARAAGRPVPMGQMSNVGGRDDLAPRLVARSHVWSFRVDASVGHQQRSWWLVYVRSNDQWERVQRHAIVE